MPGIIEVSRRGRKDCGLRSAVCLRVSTGLPGGCLGEQSAAPALLSRPAAGPEAAAAFRRNSLRHERRLCATVSFSLHPHGRPREGLPRPVSLATKGAAEFELGNLTPNATHSSFDF